MADKNVNISKSDLRHIIFERSMPENLIKVQVSITYGLLKDIFSIIEDSDGSERPLSVSNICDCLNLLCGKNVGNLVKKPCNFLKIKSRFIRNNSLCLNQLVPEFIAQSTGLSPVSDANMSLEIYCDKIGVFQSVFNIFLEKENNISIAKVLLSNYLMVLYWSWIMSDLSKTYHGQSSVLLFQNLLWLMTILHISQQTFFITMFLLLKGKEINFKKVTNWPFYLSHLFVIKKLVFAVFLMVVLVILVLSLCQLTLKLIMLLITTLLR